MRLVFVDEFYGEANKNLFGLSVVKIDSCHYQPMQSEFEQKLKEAKWPLSTEFKGRYLFSRDPKGTGKEPAEMVQLTESIIDSLSSESNSRCEAICVYNYSGFSINNYNHLLKAAIGKFQIGYSGKKDISSGKNLISFFLDGRSELFNKNNQKLIADSIYDPLTSKRYNLIERHVGVKDSDNYTTGIIFSDTLAYIGRWVIENPKAKDYTLLDLIETTSDKQKKKIDSAYKLKEKVKKFCFQKVNEV